VSLGNPCKFQRVSRLGSVTARHSGSGRQPNFAALTRGRHLYSAGRPSHWALVHILVLIIAFTKYCNQVITGYRLLDRIFETASDGLCISNICMFVCLKSCSTVNI